MNMQRSTNTDGCDEGLPALRSIHWSWLLALKTPGGSSPVYVASYHPGEALPYLTPWLLLCEKGKTFNQQSCHNIGGKEEKLLFDCVYTCCYIWIYLNRVNIHYTVSLSTQMKITASNDDIFFWVTNRLYRSIFFAQCWTVLRGRCRVPTLPPSLPFIQCINYMDKANYAGLSILMLWFHTPINSRKAR